MNQSEMSPEKVSELIGQVLEAKDPATVGLKRILRKKEKESDDFPLRGALLEEFKVAGKETVKFTDDERHVLELEKNVADLKLALKRQKTVAAEALQTAYAEGKKVGFEAGQAEGIASTTAEYEKKINALAQRVGGVISAIESSKRKVFGDAEHLLLRLCCAIAGKVIGREVALDKDIILLTIRRALSYIGHRERVVLRVAPKDMDQVSGRKDFWAPVAERLNDILIEPDERIEPGGCIIESNSGLVDARLGVQFEEVAGIVEKIWVEVTSAPAADNNEIPDEERDTDSADRSDEE